jgi:hypothetical protein
VKGKRIKVKGFPKTLKRFYDFIAVGFSQRTTSKNNGFSLNRQLAILAKAIRVSFVIRPLKGTAMKSFKSEIKEQYSHASFLGYSPPYSPAF